MKKRIVIFLVIFFGFTLQSWAENKPPLRLTKIISLKNVSGRLDHLTLDLKGNRLFVAASGNNTVEVIDLKTEKQIRTIKGFHEPQGILFLDEFNELIVANGEDGTCQILDGDSFQITKSIRLSNDADNIRYDAVSQSLYVAHGDGALGILNALTGKHVVDIELGGHPESFQLEKSGSRIFVNVPDLNQIGVIDRVKRVVLARWPLQFARANFPMTLDEDHHRLFVGCRKPSKLAVVNSETGKERGYFDISGDADDLFYDKTRQSLYISCGEGFLDVFKQLDADHYHMIARIPTVPGARTSLFVRELNRLYLAVPRSAAREAEIRVYEVQS